ncbi:hypothetical protein EDB92DRAFT_1815599 [Lactarius akahatsu]|uniref:Uncharacterized protein n=1 Tax=Lactarius akahatsu TaxID=416441 RepID=A0AAD4LIY7_9AGAM|nr:hypothetical protein EDB92DRAFT_1815599 [Lactarius akahatsu]
MGIPEQHLSSVNFTLSYVYVLSKLYYGVRTRSGGTVNVGAWRPHWPCCATRGEAGTAWPHAPLPVQMGQRAHMHPLPHKCPCVPPSPKGEGMPGVACKWGTVKLGAACPRVPHAYRAVRPREEGRGRGVMCPLSGGVAKWEGEGQGQCALVCLLSARMGCCRQGKGGRRHALMCPTCGGVDGGEERVQEAKGHCVPLICVRRGQLRSM